MKMKILNENNSEEDESKQELIIPKNSRVVLRCSERKKNLDSINSETYELNPDSAELVMNENIPDENEAVISTTSGEKSLILIIFKSGNVILIFIHVQFAKFVPILSTALIGTNLQSLFQSCPLH